MKLSLATKIFLGFSLLLSAFALLATLSVREIRAVADDLRALRDVHLALARTVAQLQTHQQNRFRDLRRGLKQKDPRNQKRVLRITQAYYPDVSRNLVNQMLTLALSPRNHPQSEEARIQLKERIQKVIENQERIDELTGQLVKSLDRNDSIDGFQNTLVQLESQTRSVIYQLDKFISDETNQAVRRAEKDERNAIWRVLVTSGFALVVGLVLTLLAARALSPIKPLVLYARAISRGDYEHPIVLRGQGELASLADELQLMALARKDREAESDRQADELEQAYSRVEQLKRYQESIVRSLSTGVIVTDRELRITSANKAARNHWLKKDRSVLGLSLLELPLGKALLDTLGPAEAWQLDQQPIQLSALTLGTILADIVIGPLESEKGAVLGVVVALEDVTEAVQTKEALLRSERLAAIGRMSAHVTHEIRNPLSSIALNAELLQDLSFDSLEASAEAKDLSRAIEKEADRLTSITEAYLKFARLPQPHLQEIDAGALLKEIARFMGPDCKAAQVELSTEIDEDLPKLSVDPDQLRQALVNLIKNAKESMPEGGQIKLSARSQEEKIVLSVKDSGGGIPEEVKERIFDPFYSTKLTGTGLGLALTQQIVQEHGGQLEVLSSPEEGTEMQLHLRAGENAKETPPALLE